MSKAKRLAIALLAAAATAAAMNGAAEPLEPRLPAASPRGNGRLPPLTGAVEWLNSRPLASADLRGRVVLVDFWTYTCINWQRTLPYVRAWAQRYRDQGLLVVGVHTPEFAFEKDVANVRRAVRDLQVDYPVAVDSDMAIWQAFGNMYWPATYIFDMHGVLRYMHAGEGRYEEQERVIQELLKETGKGSPPSDLVSVQGTGAQAPADWRELRSEENYAGQRRTENFASPGPVALDQPRAYSTPPGLALNHWALSGEWTVRDDAVRVNRPGGRIVYRFHARDLHIVMGPAPGVAPVRFRVTIDGQPPGASQGADIDADGNGTLIDQRLYQLVRQSKPIVDREFEIEFLTPGAEVFSFTFG
jgi:thiol-disulfide isomerase/thioredoxin